jgi:outer membrane protein OmpA-like peptidoglycan-associated protein
MRVLILMLTVSLLSGCISRQAHEELTESRNYFKGEAKAVDSLRLVNNALYERNRNLEADLNKAERQLEQATVTNNALLRNYQEMLTDYDRVVGNSGNVLATSAYEKQSLTERLAAQQAELDRKQREAVAMEYALQSRDDRLDAVQSYEQFGVKSGATTVQSQELNTLLENQRRQMAQLQQNLGRVLSPYGAAVAAVTLQDTRVQVSLQHSLLFTDGGIQTTAQGLQALNQIAAVLAAYTDVEVLVIGRGDSYGASDVNWEYGIQRASAVGRSLAASGVNPARILASGQGPGFSSSFGIRAVINQTDIILSPNMERVYQLLAR